MKPQKARKRKSPSCDVVFEVSDNDVSSAHSDSDADEPEAKLFKHQSFVVSVVNALDNLKSNTAGSEPVAGLPEQNNPDIKQDEDTQADTLPITCSQKEDTFEVSSNDKVSNISNEVGINEKVEVIEVDEKIENIDLQAIENEMFGKEELHTNSEINEEMAQKINDTIDDSSDLNQYIHIQFSDEKISELYRFKILKFLQSFIELEVESDDKLNISVKKDTLLNSNEWVVLDSTMCLDEHDNKIINSSSKDKTPKKKKKKEKKDKGLFVLDTNPSAADANTCSIYSSKFNIDLNDGNEAKDAVKIFVQTCFNCDGNHALKDCPSPKDFSRISAMRQKFKAHRQVSRYHLEDDQKYSHLVPGKISSQLRDALGLKKKQLPFYIYKMRVLGYPPGWLEEAKSVRSNLNMFDADGKNVQQRFKQKQGLDPEKIVDFPGFNVPLEKNYHDEFRQHRVPPYSEAYSKQVMLEYFEKQCANDNSDMDVDSNDENIHSLQQDILKTASPVHVEESVDNEDSITELVKQKEILLEALQDNSTSDVKTDDSKIGTDDSKNGTDESKNGTDDSKNGTLSILVSDTFDDDANESSALSPALNNSVNYAKESAFGTPILKSGSPYSTIPKSVNFMKDVSPVINFENLPNSTGKYEQMTNVLQKVRKTMKQKQDCGT